MDFFFHFTILVEEIALSVVTHKIRNILQIQRKRKYRKKKLMETGETIVYIQYAIVDNTV